MKPGARIRMAWRRSALGLALAVAFGCQTPLPVTPAGGPEPAARAPVPARVHEALNRLLPAEAWPGAFVIQHRVRIRFPTPDGPREEVFDAALQRRGDALLLIGFGPMQQAGFVLHLEDGELRFTNRTEREMPFRAEDILADVQRVFYPWPAKEIVCEACEGSLAVRVIERRDAGRLTRRRFVAVGRPELGEVVVDYSGAPFFDAVSTDVHVRNGWFGYELWIENQRIERID